MKKRSLFVVEHCRFFKNMFFFFFLILGAFSDTSIPGQIEARRRKRQSKKNGINTSKLLIKSLRRYMLKT